MEQSNNTGGFLGRGWSFPPTFVAASQTVTMTEGEDDIHASLEILVSTGLGERVMLPEYGCNLEDLVFEPIDTAMQTLLIDRVRTAILYYEPRIEVLDIQLQTDRILEGVLLLVVEYRVRATNSRFNFVYPFYKNEGADIPDPI